LPRRCTPGLAKGKGEEESSFFGKKEAKKLLHLASGDY
jgi:hypothetical protein